MRQLFLGADDITEHALEIPGVQVNAPDHGQLIINDLPSIVGDLSRGFWDTCNPASPFFGATALRDFPIEIRQDGVTTFTGRVNTIISDYQTKRAEVSLESDIAQKLNKTLIYASGGIKTPSTIVREIAELYKIPVDSTSFGQAEAEYSSQELEFSAVYIRPEQTVMQAIQTIVEMTAARAWIQEGRLYFEPFLEKTASALYTFSDSHSNADGITIAHPFRIEPIEKEPLTGYFVEWIGSPAAVFGDREQGKSISGTYESPVRIHDFNTATYLGETWRKFHSKLGQKVSFRTRSQIGKSLGIGFPIGINYRRCAEITADIVSIDNSSALFSSIVAQVR